MDSKVILAVDDEQYNLEFIKSIVEDENIDVITAQDGEEGLAKAIKEIPSLIILDVQMPKKDGFTTFMELRKNEKTKDIPVVMLTGIGEKRGIHFTKEQMGDFYGSEPNDYVEKPIDPEKLLNIILDQLQK
ncbi:MAG: response regulator [Candidatus Cloacimonetes bacterium]|nr:response regulator [Candidatus Cloacimonadota bacterium]